MAEYGFRVDTRALAIAAEWSYPLRANDPRYASIRDRVFVESVNGYTLYWAGGPHRAILLRLKDISEPLPLTVFSVPKDFNRPYKGRKTDAHSELILDYQDRQVEHEIKSRSATERLMYLWGDRICEEEPALHWEFFAKRLGEPTEICSTTLAAFEWEYLTQIAKTGDDLVGYKILSSPEQAVEIKGDRHVGYRIDWGDAETAVALIAPRNPVGSNRVEWIRDALESRERKPLVLL